MMVARQIVDAGMLECQAGGYAMTDRGHLRRPTVNPLCESFARPLDSRLGPMGVQGLLAQLCHDEMQDIDAILLHLRLVFDNRSCRSPGNARRMGRNEGCGCVGELSGRRVELRFSSDPGLCQGQPPRKTDRERAPAGVRALRILTASYSSVPHTRSRSHLVVIVLSIAASRPLVASA